NSELLQQTRVVGIPVALIDFRRLRNELIHFFSSSALSDKQLGLCGVHSEIPKWNQSLFVVGKQERTADVEEYDFDGHRLRLLRQTLLSAPCQVEVHGRSDQQREHHRDQDAADHRN